MIHGCRAAGFIELPVTDKAVLDAINPFIVSGGIADLVGFQGGIPFAVCNRRACAEANAVELDHIPVRPVTDFVFRCAGKPFECSGHPGRRGAGGERRGRVKKREND